MQLLAVPLFCHLADAKPQCGPFSKYGKSLFDLIPLKLLTTLNARDKL